MKLYNLKKASNYEVRKWIESSVPELTSYQKQRIRSDYDEIIRFAPFEFYKKKKKTGNSIFTRLSILPLLILLLILFLLLPINFVVSGRWGYDPDKVKWLNNWMHNVGL